MIEHNLDVIKTADWVIDLGPEGGDGRGTVVAAGTPEEIAGCEASHTGRYLARVLRGPSRHRRRASAQARQAGPRGLTRQAAAPRTAPGDRPACGAGRPRRPGLQPVGSGR